MRLFGELDYTGQSKTFHHRFQVFNINGKHSKIEFLVRSGLDRLSNILPLYWREQYLKGF